ncbi:MAG: chromosome segregation protein SMC [Erysipelotrichaceae bacterium]|uniref:chromosome segregation protein SMC n=1 Tax=Floccifex sp. TaxID=2815810 RepID=UPI002A749B68|nr:chromosome segregation protein SMC [Floccifex sp.]MDD7281426.1 chromosome segregation protein SMC [Erysipelotrichaceae bacterium]MDY2957806.1 chromosome segregation protein SMC [Floccifex sp.]
MFLKRIELLGFKSFADKTVIQFDHDITGIVGPNGCGKSNVNDAIRWVLGEQSTKSLRSGTSMSDIIFSGSEYRKPVNLAKVTLVFDNSQHIFDSPFEELEITRQISRANNEASYFINKSPCRLKDINDLVMDTGLGRDSLSIITQGNISSFADAKPEERRLLFEEAAGVAKYKKRKKVSLQKLEKTQDNLDRLQDIIDELSRQIKPLEKQAEKAKKYLGLKEELSTVEISVLVSDIEMYQNKITKIENQLRQDKMEYTSKEAAITLNEDKLTTLRKEMHSLDALVNSLQQEYTKTMQESYQLEKRKVEIDEKRKYLLKNVDQKQRQKEIQAMLNEAKFEYEDRKNRLSSLRTDLNLHKKNLEAIKNNENRASYELRQSENTYQQLLNRKQIIENNMKQPFQHQQGVKAIVQARRSLSGIEGVVSELFIPHDDKVMAVNAALGGSIYNIVTKDEASARYAIRFLKKNKSGRATFLPMSVCRPRQMNSQIQFIASNAQGYIGWANECVDCKEKYNLVRDRLLGNILVIDNLENANECAKQLKYQVKIVTLDGDIVHAGGSMTGGFTRSQSSPVTLNSELKQVEAQINGHKISRDHLIAEVQEYQRKLDQESDVCVQLQIEIAKLENVYQAKKDKYETLLEEYKQLGIALDETSNVDEDELVVQMAKMHAKLDDLTSQIQTHRARRLTIGNQVEQLENEIRLTRREMNSLQSEIHSLELKQMQFTTKQDNALNRLNSDYHMTYEYACENRQEVDLEQAKDRVLWLRQEISKLGNVNLEAPQEFEEIKERFDFLTKQKEDLELASKQILKAIDEMNETMIVQFTEMFDKINLELNESFRAMFGGGKAKLVMVDPDDVLNTGIDIIVQPPGKTIKNLQSFSGGEKALIAISVLFAILKARTMPLCIFDEVEAALDQANVERFARYLSHFRNQSQFIVVTHRPGTMEQCDTLYGVTMQQDGVSKLLKVQLKDALSLAQEEEKQ